jgi:hypothetical protein
MQHNTISHYVCLSKVYSLLIILIVIQTGSAVGQVPQSVRSIAAVQAETAPKIDGAVDDACWQTADWQGDFVQLKPDMGDPALVNTRIAIAWDEEYIYAAFRCNNPDGAASNSQMTRRDANLDQDNSVTLFLDTFRNRRDCYYFATNSLGTQVDGRIGEDGRTNDKNWDCVWSVAAQEDSLGWTAEMAIPVSELRISKDEQNSWGVNFKRNYPNFLAMSFWNESNRTWQVSRFGDMTGLGKFKKSFEIAVYPYVVSMSGTTPSVDRRTVYSSDNTEVVAGGDVRFNVGSAAQGNITVNPDFATIEADREVINTTRFETFFPEKRLFFLEGSELFSNRINVFYSRRIGDIDFGAKTNGRAGKFNYAVLSSKERKISDDPSATVSAFRLQRDILESSNIGLLAVNRSYTGGYNRVVSSDASIYLPSDVMITAQLVGSFPSEDKKTHAFFVRAAREDEIYHYHLRFTTLQPGFRQNVNEVGFIQDDDRREFDSDITYKWWVRKNGIERMSFLSKNNLFWNYDWDTFRHSKIVQFVGMTLTNKIGLGLSHHYYSELYEKRFHNRVLIPEIGYNMQNWYSYSLAYLTGRNYDRDIRQWAASSRFKLNQGLSLEYRFNHLRFNPDPTDKGTVLNILSADYNFTPDLWFRLFMQHRSRNDRFYLYGLLGWRFAPPFGALYIAYTGDRFDQMDEFDSVLRRENNRTFFMKLSLPLTL